MLKINFLPFPKLSTERLLLRQITTDDINEFYAIKSNEEVLKYVDIKPKSFDQALDFIYRLNNSITNNEDITWAITVKNHDKLIGTICYWNLSKERSSAEIGYELMPDYHGKGIMSEAMQAVIKYGFEEMKLHTIEAFPNIENIKSIRILERNNFIRRGKLTDNNYNYVISKN